MEKEQWRPVPGFEGTYAVSNRGRVRSEARTVGARRLRRQILRASYPRRTRYAQLTLCIGNRKTCAKVHTLVAAAFLGPRPPGMDIDHIDANPRNNSASNLEYVTRAENERRAMPFRPRGERHGRATKPHRTARGERHGNAKLTADDVRHIRALLGAMPQKDIAEMYGLGCSHITRIKRGECWAHVV